MTGNRIVPIIAMIVVIIAAGVVLRSGDRSKEAAVMSSMPDAPAPDADTPADTVRSLSAQVAELTDQTRGLIDENKQLVAQNQQALALEGRVANKLRSELAGDVASRGVAEQQTISALTAKVKRLGARFEDATNKAEAAPTDGMPVGFGYGGGVSDAIHWIEGLDAPAAGPGGKGSPFAKVSVNTGSLLHPEGTATAPLNDLGQVSGKAGTSLSGAGDKDADIEPVYTIPANATLTQSTAFSALVGRIPIGGQVQDPMPFKVLIGAENLAANGHYIPGLEGMVMSGIATGDWTLSCVRGNIMSATFVFDDGRVLTFNEQKRGQGSRANASQSEGIGWISDRHGVPCISGKRITNAPTFLAQRIGVMALSAAAEAAAASQTTNTVSAEGVGNSTVTGDQGQFVLGKTVSGGADEIGTWLTQRQAQSFDAIFVAAGEPLVVHLDETIEIDYNSLGRKLDHHARLTGPGGAYGYLD